MAASCLSAQDANVVSASAKGPQTVKRGATFQVPLTVTIRKGFHINSHQPEDKYLIPLSLRWDSPLAEAGETQYPEPARRRFAFSDKELSVFEGKFDLKQTLRIKPEVTRGFSSIGGKLRYQACTESECLPPTSIPIRVTVDIQ
jgi:thioredoxin:protein disulfide reductase